MYSYYKRYLYAFIAIVLFSIGSIIPMNATANQSGTTTVTNNDGSSLIAHRGYRGYRSSYYRNYYPSYNYGYGYYPYSSYGYSRYSYYPYSSSYYDYDYYPYDSYYYSYPYSSYYYSYPSYRGGVYFRF